MELMVHPQGRTERLPPVPHVRKHEDVLDAREAPDQPVEPDIGCDAARQSDLFHSRFFQRVFSPFQDLGLQNPLGHISELLEREFPQDAFQSQEHAPAVVTGAQLQPLDFEKIHHRVGFIFHRIGISGQGHHLALIFELPHIQKGRHLLVEDSQRARSGNGGDAAELVVFKDADAGRQGVADAVDGEHQGRVKPAAEGGRGGVRVMMIDPMQGMSAEPERT